MAIVTPYTIDLTFPACPVVNSKWWNDYIINGVHACLEFNDTADITTKGSVTVVGNERIYFNDTNSYIGDPVPNGTTGLVIYDSSRLNLQSPAVYVGDGATATIPIVFNVTDGDGSRFQWESVAGYFQFYDDILIRNNEKMYFRDTALSIHSDADTFIDYTADGSHRFAGAVTMDTSLDIGSSVAVTGVLDQDSMADDSAVKLCTQQSIKAYVDSQISGGTYWDRTGTILSTITADDDITIGNGHLIVDTTTLVVNASGYADKVGIGTATPATKFTVVEGSGEFRINQTSIDYFSTNSGITNNPARINAYRSREGAVVDDADNLFWLIAYGHDGTDLNTQAAAIKISVDETAQTVTTNRVPTKIEFQTAEGAGDSDNSTKLTILPGGNTGIGVTDPDSLLEVAGTAHIQGAATLNSYLEYVVGVNVAVLLSKTGTDEGLLRLNDSGVTKINLSANGASYFNGGAVGFGIASPDGTVHIHTATAGTITASTSADDLVIENSADGGLSILSPDASSSQIYFGSPSDPVGAGINWAHDSNLMVVGTQNAGGTLAFRVDDSINALTIDAAKDATFIGSVTITGNEKLYFNDTNSYIGDAVPNGVVGLVISDTSRINLSSPSIYIGDGTTNNVLITGDVSIGELTTTEGRIKNTTRIISTDSPYTALATDHAIFVDTDGGAITVNLPAGVDGTEYQISNCGSSGNDVTVDGSTTETINGSLTQTLNDDEAINIIFETTENWRVF